MFPFQYFHRNYFIQGFFPLASYGVGVLQYRASPDRLHFVASSKPLEFRSEKRPLDYFAGADE